MSLHRYQTRLLAAAAVCICVVLMTLLWMHAHERPQEDASVVAPTAKPAADTVSATPPEPSPEIDVSQLLQQIAGVDESDAPPPVQKDLAGRFPKTWERLQARLAELRQETLEESLENLLYDGKNYLFPGQLLISAQLPNPPLPPEFGKEDIDLLLSNRRIEKLLSELQALPRDQAASLIVKYLEEGLNRYREMYTALTSGNGSEAEFAGGMVIGNLPDGSPSLNLARMNLLSLAFLASQLQIPEANPLLIQMALEAQQQRDTLYEAATAGVPGSATHGIRHISLYNRQILAYALAATSGSDLSPEEILAQWSVHTRDEVLPPWDATVGPRDSIVFKEPAVPGEDGLQVTYIVFITDTLFDEILAAFTEL